MRRFLGSLQAKTLTGLFVVVSAVILLIFAINDRNQSRGMQALLSHSGENMGHMTYAGILTAITRGDDGAVRRQMKDIHRHVREVMVLVCDFSGEVTYATHPQVERQPVSRAIPDPQVNQALKRGLAGKALKTRSFLTDGHLVNLMFIPNQPACHHCHGSSRQVLGAMVVRQSTAQVTAQTRKMRTVGLLMALGGVILTCLLLFVVLRRLVNRPVRQILRVSEAVAEGDLKQEITYRSRDELGQLAESLRKTLAQMIARFGESESVRQGIPDPFFTVDREMNVIYLNPAAERLGGRKAEEVVGRAKCHEVFGSEACDANCPVRQAMDTGQAVSDQKMSVRIGDREIPMMVSANVLNDMDGNIIGGMEILRDITADVQAQQEIERHRTDLLQVAGEVTEMAGRLASSASEISASTEEMSAGADLQSRTMESAAQTVEQMNATVGRTADNAAAGAEEAKATGDIALEGGTMVARTVEAINQTSEGVTEVAGTVADLSKKSEEIEKVVRVIEDIADQTNLLALNAAIEAARAGDAGRGFSVVAEEVRKLAEKTTGATREVAETVRAIQDSTAATVTRMEQTQANVTQGVELASQAGEVLDQIVERVGKVSVMMSEIAQATEEQSAAMKDLGQNVDGMASGAKEAAAAVGEAAQAANSLSDLAAKLTDIVVRFKT
ncbi:MAG: PAS domain-containing protein [Proteobacteria bacterium]|nr:PAS domain-containing protein [Pseudomonadota bacterium]MBU1742102.1 PAS domain-containing protein [Pseudomonadota bacterium]